MSFLSLFYFRSEDLWKAESAELLEQAVIIEKLEAQLNETISRNDLLTESFNEKNLTYLNDIAVLNSQLEQTNLELNGLKLQLLEAVEKDLLYHKLENELNASNKCNESLQLELQRQQMIKDDLETGINVVKEANKLSKIAQIEQQDAISGLQKDLIIANSNNCSIQIQLETLEKELAISKEVDESLQNTTMKQAHMVTEVEHMLATLQESSRLEYQRLSDVVISLEYELNESKDKIDRLQCSEIHLAETTAGLELELTASNDKCISLQNELDDSIIQLKDLQECLMNSTMERNQSEKMLQLSAETQVKVIEVKYNELLQRYDTLENSYADKRIKSIDELDEIKFNSNKLLEKNTSLEDEKAQQGIQHNNLLVKINSLEDEKAQQEIQHKENIEMINTLNKKIECLSQVCCFFLSFFVFFVIHKPCLGKCALEIARK